MKLSSIDQDLIDRFGTPELTSPYGCASASGAITLTARGRALFSASLHQHGLDPAAVDTITDRESLREIRLAIARARLARSSAQAARAIGNGSVPVRARALLQKLLYESPARWAQALAQRERCESAGSNVLAVHFGRSAAKSPRS